MGHKVNLINLMPHAMQSMVENGVLVALPQIGQKVAYSIVLFAGLASHSGPLVRAHHCTSVPS